MSVGLAGVFIPASSTALIGVGHHDAGVASAVLNTSQQIGGSLGTALLNTLFAGAVTAYLADNVTSPADAAKLDAVGADPRLPRGVLLGRRAARSRRCVVRGLCSSTPRRTTSRTRRKRRDSRLTQTTPGLSRHGDRARVAGRVRAPTR